MASDKTNGLVIDCNSHVYEPEAIWDRYVPQEYRVPVRTAFWHCVDAATGLITVVLNGRSARPMTQSRIIRQAIWRPGMSLDDIGALDPNKPHPINPGAQDPDARVKDMDRMGIRHAVVFPTLFLEYLPVVENPDMARVLASAYNDWVADFCGTHRDRLIPAAILPMQDVGLAIKEVRRAAANNFKAVVIRPSFFEGRFLNHPYYNELWKELDRANLAVFLHPSSGSTNPEWTSEGSYVDRIAANLRIGHYISESIAPMMDNSLLMVAFCFYGHLEEYPKLRIAFTNSGASWVPLALEKAETRLALNRIPDVSLEPEHVWEERGTSMAVFHAWESSVMRQYEDFAKFAAFGSGYPFHDTATPAEARANIEKYSVPAEAAARLMGANAARFLNL